MKRLTSFFLALYAAAALVTHAAEPQRVDVCVYGATPSGIVAAVTAKQEGCSVLIVEPSRWVGGILGAGIKPMQDCAEPVAVGGLTTSRVFKMGRQPDVLRKDFADWLAEEKIPVIYEQRVQRVEKAGTSIAKLILELAPPDKNGVPAPTAKHKDVSTIEAKVFIDASYEGDVMAAAGVKYAVGRESADTYQEELAGVGPTTNWTPIDPYVVPGDPKSGLLPWVEADHGLPKGAADDYTQAYNFRYYVTRDPEMRVPFEKPAEYSAKDFELVGRYVEYLVSTIPGDEAKLMKRLRDIFPGWMNSGEYNYKRDSLITMAPLGVSRFYQDGTWEARSKVWRQHMDYLSGLHEFLSTDARVPEAFRKETAELGRDKTMHADTDGWPNQLYVRITRRMKGPYILTLADVWNQTKADDGVGLALYGVDIYPVRRYVVANESGQTGVATEGNMFVGGSQGTGHPYPVSYRALTPKPDECTNLLVPVCFSASYIAYASARMEPVFCVLGESAGVAASQAIRSNTSVQSIDFKKLRSRLLERGQILEWTDELAAQAKPRHKGGITTGEFASQQAWNDSKPGWEWLFPFIDTDKDGKISLKEHESFQDYKKQHPDWQKTLKAQVKE
ncbi:FAD-dependent oxidoreductase [Prosthecobacter sp.]|uniref:FAD-dependent oxidoreductase n=1 Tax=Prosthecobacter sp. TaxID=1965333 RepID=UPI001E0270D5|nr:FAD-dependent oxidoreductase [Prosthecobacter sp.]MCB1279842.1 FAD-dependent oxidoreductase [Prosthecobacter sp.]